MAASTAAAAVLQILGFAFRFQIVHLFTRDENVIAIGCKNKNGGAMIDLGFYSELKLED